MQTKWTTGKAADLMTPTSAEACKQQQQQQQVDDAIQFTASLRG